MRYAVQYDVHWCSLSREGRDSVAWHGDRNRLEMVDPIIALVSVGEYRPFLVRRRGGGPSIRYETGRGDLVVMGGSCQHDWEHTVPKLASHVGPRISIGFRHSAPANAGATPDASASKRSATGPAWGRDPYGARRDGARRHDLARRT